MRDLLEPVAVHAEVVGEALELVGAELLQGVPPALGELERGSLFEPLSLQKLAHGQDSFWEVAPRGWKRVPKLKNE